MKKPKLTLEIKCPSCKIDLLLIFTKPYAYCPGCGHTLLRSRYDLDTTQ